MKTITEDILSWSKDFVELPNKHLGNLPTCPYAKTARLKGQIRIVEEPKGEDFLITDVVTNKDGSFIIDSEGISELVKGKKFCFDTSIDKDIRAVDPINTKFIHYMWNVKVKV